MSRMIHVCDYCDAKATVTARMTESRSGGLIGRLFKRTLVDLRACGEHAPEMYRQMKEAAASDG
jgi:hypothetical protein